MDDVSPIRWLIDFVAVTKRHPYWSGFVAIAAIAVTIGILIPTNTDEQLAAIGTDKIGAELPIGQMKDQKKPLAAQSDRMPSNDKDSDTTQTDLGEEDKLTQRQPDGEWLSPPTEEGNLKRYGLDTAIELFEDRVLNHTDTRWLKVETNFVSPDDPAYDGRSNDRLPGYVAFSTKPEASHSEGVTRTAEDIASEYFAAFPQAPSVRVSLVVGGRVIGGKTFRQNK